MRKPPSTERASASTERGESVILVGQALAPDALRSDLRERNSLKGLEGFRAPENPFVNC